MTSGKRVIAGAAIAAGALLLSIGPAQAGTRVTSDPGGTRVTSDPGTRVTSDPGGTRVT